MNALTCLTISLCQVLRQNEGEGDDDMAEEHNESEEDDMVEKVQDKDLKVEEEGPSAPSTSKPSSLTALLGQTFTVVATVKPKTAQTRAEEEVQKYLEAPSLPLTDNPLEWWSTNELNMCILS